MGDRTLHSRWGPDLSKVKLGVVGAASLLVGILLSTLEYPPRLSIKVNASIKKRVVDSVVYMFVLLNGFPLVFLWPHADAVRYLCLPVSICRPLRSNRAARTAGEKPAQREAARSKKSVVGVVRQWKPDQNSLPGPGCRRKLQLQRRGSSEAALAVGPLKVTSIVIKPFAHGELYEGVECCSRQGTKCYEVLGRGGVESYLVSR